ncbi:hypothetical protein Ade02nite_73710 [Paractinoplanes deccanensis]|uniref:Glycerophosphoryl diester phosphodiesterase membrane domain-containing protein n=1 Tax=Paractinoplanes deccanensis TaxID=113561 RepID=A0ABQ3YFP8_9ACTN|nr:hypothetical protein [Actinoplanes deccanensis]GID78730.1 hypothetical protein Ade02nite_73710 [Actinoplanes deccanensis]
MSTTPPDDPDPSAVPPGQFPPPPRYPVPPGYQPLTGPPEPPPYAPPPPGYQGPWTAGARATFHAGPADPLVSADYNGWWQRTVALLTAAWRPMALVQLIGAAPLLVLAVIFGVGFTPAGFADSWDSDDVATALAVLLPIVLAAILLSLLVQLATLDVAVQHATGRPVSIAAALRTGLRRLPALAGWGLLGGLVVLVGFLLCVLPAFYVGAALATLPVIVLVERGAAIGRAFRLFHGDFGSSIARVATLAAVQIALAVIEGISGFITALDPTGITGGVTSVASALVSGVVVAPFLLTTYADMRARVEPFRTADLA